MDNVRDGELSGLILEVRSGSDSAFTELVKRYTPMMRKVISGFAGLRADEAFSEACVAFFRAVSTYDVSRTDVTFGLYARICVYRRLCDLAGRENRREELISDVDVNLLVVFSDIEGELVSREAMSDTLKKVRNILSEYEYEVFVLYLQGLTTAKIAEKLGKTAKSIDNAKARCFKRLREESDKFSDI